MKAEILRRSVKQVIYDLQEKHENITKECSDYPTRLSSVLSQKMLLSNLLILITEIRKISLDDESVDCGEYLDIIQLEDLIQEYNCYLDALI